MTLRDLHYDLSFYTQMLRMAQNSVDFWVRWGDSDKDAVHLAKQRTAVRRYRMKIVWANQKLTEYKTRY